ncbi:MAG: NUDIX domain-containing protein [Halobacteriota archaeon]
MDHVVTAFLRNRGEILLVRRSDSVGTYPQHWGGVSGYVEGDPADALADARREVREETGLETTHLVRAGDPLTVVDGTRTWEVHPFLFDVDTRDVEPNEELAAIDWAPPTVIRARETVPGLWDAYERVAPTVADVCEDTEHGSAAISITALEVLRDAAAVADDWETVAGVARRLREARPSMAAVSNRINRVMAASDRTPDAVLAHAIEAIDAAFTADELAAEHAVAFLDGTVLTLSRSGTVLDALKKSQSPVVVTESRPGGEGVDTAGDLVVAGLDVTLTTDAAVSTAVIDADVVLVGADAILADGSVVNKVGTRTLGLAAAREGVPMYVVAARDKIRHDETMVVETAPPETLTPGDEAVALDLLNPLFDRTPTDLVTGVVTEAGLFSDVDVVTTADELRALAEWDRSTE